MQENAIQYMQQIRKTPSVQSVKATFEQSEQVSNKSHPSSVKSQSVSRTHSMSHSMKSSSTAVFPPPPSSVFEHEIIPPPQNHPPPQPMSGDQLLAGSQQKGHTPLIANEQQEQPLSSNNNTNTSQDHNPIPLPQPTQSYGPGMSHRINSYDEILETKRNSLDKNTQRSPDSTPSHIPPPVATLGHSSSLMSQSTLSQQMMSHHSTTTGANSIHASPTKGVTKRAPIPPQRSTAPPSTNVMQDDKLNHIFHESPA